MLETYWSWALGLSAAYYGGIVFIGKHLSPKAKENFTYWLAGAFENNWAKEFCEIFDTVFGHEHWSWKCFYRSSIASISAVLITYFIMSQALGLVGSRAEDDITFLQVLLVGVLVNILCDYCSLYQTRWVLGQFKTSDRALRQISLLLIDVIITLIIIWIGISMLHLIRGSELKSPTEMAAVYSSYSIFFYSTFFTTVWAWLFCMSTWFVRLFSKTRLFEVLDSENKPIQVMALVSGVILFSFSLVLRPLSISSDDGITILDRLLCSVDPSVCHHTVRLAGNETDFATILFDACNAKDWTDCAKTAAFIEEKFADQEIGEHRVQSELLNLWQINCGKGQPLACNFVAVNEAQGLKNSTDHRSKAINLFKFACKGGYAISCYNLALQLAFNAHMHGSGDAEVVEALDDACTLESLIGCITLSYLYFDGRFVSRDLESASFYASEAIGKRDRALHFPHFGESPFSTNPYIWQALKVDDCDKESWNVDDCFEIGIAYELGASNKYGISYEQSYEDAAKYYLKTCELNHAEGCRNLSVLYEFERVVPDNPFLADQFRRKACSDGGNRIMCPHFWKLPPMLAEEYYYNRPN